MLKTLFPARYFSPFCYTLLIVVFLTGSVSISRTASSQSARATGSGSDSSSEEVFRSLTAAQSAVPNWTRPLPAPIVPPRDFRQAIDNGTRTSTGLPGEKYWQNETDYQFTARLLPEEKRLEAEGRIVYTNHSPDSLQTIYLELVQNLHSEGVVRNEPVEITGGTSIEYIRVDGMEYHERERGRPFFVVDGTRLVLVLARPLGTDQSVTIELAWNFPIPRSGAGGRMGYSQDNLFFLAYWYPALLVYDDVEGWNTDSFLGQSEFYYGFGNYDITIEAPENWVVTATGELTNPEEVLPDDIRARLQQACTSDEVVRVLNPEDFEGTVTHAGTDGYLQWRFKADRVRDFVFGVSRNSYWDATRAAVGDRDGDGEEDYTQIHTIYREHAPLWKNVADYERQSISFLSEFTGFSYPWPHMTAIEGGGIIGGGMEFPMMTLMGDYSMAGDEALLAVTLHELAHMWIPMIVSTNERRFAWIDEGSTTFAENQGKKHLLHGRNYDLSDQMSYIYIARQGGEGEIMRWSNYHYTPASYLTASYPKPATLLVALRGVLGEETFNRAYQSFIETWAYKHPYPYDFFNTFERVSGRDLDWFWRSWYFETWTLDQAIADVKLEGETAEIVIEDKGEAIMPVLLEITLADGSTLQHQIPAEAWLDGATETSVTLNTGNAVQRVVIDPGHVFPDVDRSNNTWGRTPGN